MNTYQMAAPHRSWFGRIEDWLDERGRGAWIAAMVLGFILFWPVGLALVLYITFTNRWRKNAMFGLNRCSKHQKMERAQQAFHAMRSSGNAAFDAYKTDTLRRLEEEQEAFETFLQRLREAKDKQEFDAFMHDRAEKVRSTVPVDNEAPGAY